MPSCPARSCRMHSSRMSISFFVVLRRLTIFASFQFLRGSASLNGKWAWLCLAGRRMPFDLRAGRGGVPATELCCCLLLPSVVIEFCAFSIALAQVDVRDVVLARSRPMAACEAGSDHVERPPVLPCAKHNVLVAQHHRPHAIGRTLLDKDQRE